MGKRNTTGYLPLELSRCELALDYHIYSMHPFQAFAMLAARQGIHLENECIGGLERLRSQTLAAIGNLDAMSERAGSKQIPHMSDSTS